MIINIEVLILFMAVITFTCRYLFFMHAFPISFNTHTKKILEYTAPSVLTAMWVPIVFLGHETINTNFYTSPYLYAGCITLFAALKLKSTLHIVLVGMGSFLAIHWVAFYLASLIQV